jgi:DNA-binding transcriptional LysR family regulator
MSHALARLRTLFNDPLLLNRSGAMTPTARAQEIFVEVENLLARFDKLLEVPEEFDPLNSRTRLSIMAPEFASDFIAAPLLCRLAKEAPHVEVKFVAGDPVRALELLEAGTVDFRLGWWPDPAPVLRHRPLWSEKLVCIMRKDHPLAIAPMDENHFFDANHIRITRQGRSFSIANIDAAANRAGRKMQVSAWVPNASTMARVIANTDLLGVMGERLAASFSYMNLQLVPMPIDIPDLRVALYWHERSHRHPAHRWFRKVLSEIIP